MAELLLCADTSLMVAFAADEEAAGRVLALDAALAGEPGIADLVPGLDTLLVIFDGSLRPAEVRRRVAAALAALGPTAAPPKGLQVDLEVRFGGDDGPDLEEVAARAGVGSRELVGLLTGLELTVALVGHLPGLPYLRGLPPALDLPRRSQPRTAVAAGSLGIAAAMACVYPVRAPGGWHIVGRTDARLYDLHRDPPFLLAPGDRVRLHPAG